MVRRNGPARTAPAGPAAAVALGGLATLAAAAFLLAPGWNAPPSRAPRAPVQVGNPVDDATAATSRALAVARGEDRLGPRLADAVRLAPPSAGSGLVVGVATDPQLLAIAGLKAGDLLLESDDRAVAPTGEAMVKEQWGSLDAVEVMVQRDGQLRQLTIDLARQPSSSSSS